MPASKQILLNHVVSRMWVAKRSSIFLECPVFGQLALPSHNAASPLAIQAGDLSEYDELGLALRGVMSDASNSSSAFAQLSGSSASATGLKTQDKLPHAVLKLQPLLASLASGDLALSRSVLRPLRHLRTRKRNVRNTCQIRRSGSGSCASFNTPGPWAVTRSGVWDGRPRTATPLTRTMLVILRLGPLCVRGVLDTNSAKSSP